VKKMTGEQTELLDEFERKLRALLVICENQKKKIAELTAQLHEEENRTQQAQEEIRLSEAKYGDLLTAHAASALCGDVKSARKHVLNMVREVDKCIALLNG
jgi:cell division septum initiation protein DivIVA